MAESEDDIRRRAAKVLYGVDTPEEAIELHNEISERVDREQRERALILFAEAFGEPMIHPDESVAEFRKRIATSAPEESAQSQQPDRR